jgi:hypothetical protein
MRRVDSMHWSRTSSPRVATWPRKVCDLASPHSSTPSIVHESPLCRLHPPICRLRRPSTENGSFAFVRRASQRPSSTTCFLPIPVPCYPQFKTPQTPHRRYAPYCHPRFRFIIVIMILGAGSLPPPKTSISVGDGQQRKRIHPTLSLSAQHRDVSLVAAEPPYSLVMLKALFNPSISFSAAHRDRRPATRCSHGFESRPHNAPSHPRWLNLKDMATANFHC